MSTAAAAGAGLLGVSTGHEPFLAAAALFAAVPVGYAATSLLRRGPEMPRLALGVVALVCVGLLVPATMLALGSCRKLETGADLAGCDLAARDLSGLDLSEADLSGADLTEANLRGTSLRDADLAGASLVGADLTGADLDGAVLARAVLAGQDLSGRDFVEADLTEADLAGADLAEADLSGANLSDADLSGADLSAADLSGAILVSTLLSEAVASQADLSNATLTEAVFDAADLQQAKLTGSDATGASFVGANLAAARLDDALLAGADLSDARLPQARLRRTDLSGAILAGADAQGARVDGADLTGADLTGAEIRGASFVGSTGLTDEGLLAALGVSDGSLASTLTAQEVRLEARDDILASLGAACGGGSPDAGAFPFGDVHPMVLLATNGSPTGLTGDLPSEWEPAAVRFAQLVACTEEDREVVQVCGGYIDLTTGAPAPGITRYRQILRVRVVEAQTGALVDEQTFTGGDPRACRPTESLSTTEIEGSPVRFAQIRPFLDGFVG